jgi:hypothetical protein
MTQRSDSMIVPNPSAPEGDERTFCAVHPTVETSLRCNRCGRYMCVKCAVKTPVGYRCKECVYEQQNAYFNANQFDYVIAAVVAFVMSAPLGLIATRAGLFLVIILAIPAGGLIGEVVHRVVRKRRGRYTWVVAAVAIVAGAVVGALLTLGPILQSLSTLSEVDPAGTVVRSLFPTLLIELLPTLLYAVMCTGGAIARLRYGK